MKKIGIVCCSNGLNADKKPQLDSMIEILDKNNIKALLSHCIYETDGIRSAPADARALELMKLFGENEVDGIYDISGGDIANEILPHLDFNIIGKSRAVFYGYSDLTTVINAIYTKTGKESGLYQVMHIVKPYNGEKETVWRENDEQLFYFINGKQGFDYEFLRGSMMEGVVVGGNIRCFLKLAGTEYFPDLTGKILLLEALGGELPQMITYLSWLEQLGAFRKLNGILLGTFTRIEGICQKEEFYREVLKFSGSLPVAFTREIGHGADAKCCMIGRKYRFDKMH